MQNLRHNWQKRATSTLWTAFPPVGDSVTLKLTMYCSPPAVTVDWKSAVGMVYAVPESVCPVSVPTPVKLAALTTSGRDVRMESVPGGKRSIPPQ